MPAPLIRSNLRAMTPNPTNTHTNRTAWCAVSAMFALNGALYGIWASRIPAVAQTHALDKADLGWLLLLLAAGAITAFPLAGRLADRRGAAPVTLTIAVAYTVMLAAIGFAPSVALLAVALFCFGVTHGAMDVTMNAWAGEVEHHIGRPVMSSFHAMFSLGAGLGAATGFAAEHWGIGTGPHFAAVGTVTALLTLWIARIRWQSPRHATTTDAPLFSLPKGPLVAVGLIAFCTSMGEGAMVDWSALLIIETTTQTPAKAALGYTTFSVAMVITRLLGDQATRLMGPVATARVAGLVATAGTLCAVLSGSFAMTLTGFCLMGVGYAVIVPLAFSRAASDPNLPPGTAIASVATLGYGGLLLGPPIIGFVAHASDLRTGFGVLALLAVLIVVLAPAVRRSRA
ncbi:MFS transporter [uncultured Tateyamaria sp.]|uniref:MFS transporter n=1 Tax=uncultured Tateyamaria sp. TaxID=455651 RepID=UPI00261C4875|nr:MFS transporter [uncultured Tateyamaria sp.]